MKKYIFLIAALFIGFKSFAQNNLDKWPELKTFHGVMAQTFHPSEEGDLGPIKQRASEMVEKAQALVSSNIPAEFATDKIKDAVQRLAVGSRELSAMVEKKEADDAITKKLSSLHDVFHEIVGLCMHPEGEKHEHQE